MSKETLFQPYTLNGLELKNRIVLAPCTRSRADDKGVHPKEAAYYYAQRAMAGLIIAEAANISPCAKAYPNTPSIYTEEQAQAWEMVVKSVHELECKIILQIYHGGRISHPLTQPDSQVPIAPSAIKPNGMIFTKKGPQEFVQPREMDAGDIARVVSEFENAASLAKQAGFDGIEIHSANGYLLDQFLRPCANKRTDSYGGPIENRMRLLMDVVKAVSTSWSLDQVGVRISPTNEYNSISDGNPQETFIHVAIELSKAGISFLDVIETGMVSRHVKNENKTATTQEFDWTIIRENFKGVYMANGDYTRERAINAIDSGHADLVSFGRDFLSNPDLPFRLEHDLELNPPDKDSFYEGGPIKGYIDYPFHPKNADYQKKYRAVFSLPE